VYVNTAFLNVNSWFSVIKPGIKYNKQPQAWLHKNQIYIYNIYLLPPWLNSHSGPRPPTVEVSWSYIHIIFNRTTLDEWPIHCRDFYLTTYNTHKRQISMFPVGYEPKFPASEWSQTHALDRAATGMGFVNLLDAINDHTLELLIRH
jgi:hypothetical protein